MIIKVNNVKNTRSFIYNLIKITRKNNKNFINIYYYNYYIYYYYIYYYLNFKIVVLIIIIIKSLFNFYNTLKYK